MKQAKASTEEAEALLFWLQKQDGEKFLHPELRPPPYARTVHGYLLLKEHCTDPAKDYLDWKPGYAPADTDALRDENAKLIDALFAAYEFLPDGSLKETCDRLLEKHETSSANTETSQPRGQAHE